MNDRYRPAIAACRSVVLVVVACLLLPVTIPAVGWAQDDPEVIPAVTSVSLRDLGLGESVQLAGRRGTAQLTIPVPPGTVPTLLRGTLDVPPGTERGWLDITSSDRIVGRIDIPAGVPFVPVALPLAGVEIVDDTVTLTLITTLIESAGYCFDTRASSLTRLQDPVVDYEGNPANPTVVADFLPPYLRTLTVFVPTDPTPEQSTAVLMLATAVVDYYGAQPVRVVVRPENDVSVAAPDGPFDRSVVITPNNDGNAELVFPSAPGAPPQLFVSGTGRTLEDQIALITSDVSALAVGTRVNVESAPSPPVLSADSMTLSDVDLGSLTASGTRDVVVTVPLDQTRLGRAVSNLRLHLQGQYTPLSSQTGGVVRVSVGDTDLATWPADSSGVIDRWVDLPADRIERVTNVDVSLTTSETGGLCGSGSTVNLSIDDDTVIASEGGTPAAGGFAAVPQSLMPAVAVAMVGDPFANTVRATSLLTGLQRLSARALAPTVVSLDEAVSGSAPAILIEPDVVNSTDQSVRDIDLPLSRRGTSVLTLREPGSESDGTRVTVDGTSQFAAVQVARDNDRTVVMATSSDASQLDAMLNWLAEDPIRWNRVDGDVLFGAGQREPISLSSGADAAPDGSVVAGSTAPSGVWAILAAGGIALVLGVVAAVLVFARSRGRQDVLPGRDSDPS